MPIYTPISILAGLMETWSAANSTSRTDSAPSREEFGVLLSKPPTSPYCYIPSLGAGIAFLTLFSILTLIHLFLAVWYRYWTAIISMVFGGILEIIGWAGRVWSNKNVLLWENFIMQTVCTIIAPVFFSGWIYILLAMAIQRLGQEYSFIGHELYVVIFIIADIVSIIVQAVGGGGAADDAKNYTSTKKNTHIMLAGILFQVGSTAIFAILGTDFILRVLLDKPYPAWWKNMFVNKRHTWVRRWLDRRWAVEGNGNGGNGGNGDDDSAANLNAPRESGDTSSPRSSNGGSTVSSRTSSSTPREKPPRESKYHNHNHVQARPPAYARASPSSSTRTRLRNTEFLLAGVALATILILLRGIYRAVELAGGWTGYVMRTERFFWWLDAFPMLLLMTALAAGHPGFWMPRRRWRGCVWGTGAV